MSVPIRDEGDPVPEDMLEEFVGDVRTCLSRRGVIDQYLTDVYIRRPKENNLQSELNDFFEEEPELSRLYTLSISPSIGLSASLTQALEEELISEQTIAEFNDFWENISWASEPARAFFLYDELNVSYWTNKSIRFTVYEDRVIVKNTMKWGLSEVHDLSIPLDVFVDDAGDRLQEVISWLQNRSEEDEFLTDQLVDDLEQDAERIADHANQLMDVLEEFDTRE